MKRAERHHLKENELALYVADLKGQYASHRREIVAGLATVLVLLLVVGGYIAWRERTNTRASALLAEAMTVAQAQVAPPAAPPEPGTTPPKPPPGTYPSERAKLEAALPKFLAAADAYPTAQAGIAARYHAAATLAALGRSAEAEQRYREVIDRGGDGLYGQMARLGAAEVQASAGKYDPAIAAFKELASRTTAEIPVDGVLMQLARTYARAGRTEEATRTFDRIVAEFPQSLYAQDAREELAQLKGKS
jgi:TolA-binding protein